MFAMFRRLAQAVPLLALLLATSALAGEARYQCYDGIDNDQDGYIDGADTDCGASSSPNPPKDLKTFLAQLQGQVDSMQNQIASLNDEIAFLNSEVQALQAGGGGGDSHPALTYMDVFNGELIISGIDVRIQNGNMLIGEGGVGAGLHNLVVGHSNIWDGNYGVIIGTNNESTKDHTFIHGDWHTVRGTYSAILGGLGSKILSTNSVIIGGSQNLIQNFGVATLMGGRQRTGGNTTYEVLADG